jgi:hypothetical protein
LNTRSPEITSGDFFMTGDLKMLMFLAGCAVVVVIVAALLWLVTQRDYPDGRDG